MMPDKEPTLSDAERAELEYYSAERRQAVNREAQYWEHLWQARHLVFAWIDHDFEWVAGDNRWDLYLPEPGAPVRRIIRLCLAGGGQIRVAETFVRGHWPDGEPFIVRHRPVQLTVTAHLDDRVTRVAGSIGRTQQYEGDRAAVVLPRGSAQAVATARRPPCGSSNLRTISSRCSTAPPAARSAVTNWSMTCRSC